MNHETRFPLADDMPLLPSKSNRRTDACTDTCLDQLVIRAHYLALDLRVAALEADIADPTLTLLAADFLRYWAVATGDRQLCVAD